MFTFTQPSNDLIPPGQLSQVIPDSDFFRLSTEGNLLQVSNSSNFTVTFYTLSGSSYSESDTVSSLGPCGFKDNIGVARTNDASGNEFDLYEFDGVNWTLQQQLNTTNGVFLDVIMHGDFIVYLTPGRFISMFQNTTGSTWVEFTGTVQYLNQTAAEEISQRSFNNQVGLIELGVIKISHFDGSAIVEDTINGQTGNAEAITFKDDSTLYYVDSTAGALGEVHSLTRVGNVWTDQGAFVTGTEHIHTFPIDHTWYHYTIGAIDFSTYLNVDYLMIGAAEQDDDTFRPTVATYRGTDNGGTISVEYTSPDDTIGNHDRYRS